MSEPSEDVRNALPESLKSLHDAAYAALRAGNRFSSDSELQASLTDIARACDRLKPWFA